MTTTKLVCWLFLGIILLLAGVVAPDENASSPTSEAPTTGPTSDASTTGTEATSESPTTSVTETTPTDKATTTESTGSTAEVTTESTTEAVTEVSTEGSSDTTSTPVITTAEPSPTPCKHGQHFDAASFIGGIVLALGIVAIAFFGWKFYKSKTNHRYSQF